MIATARYLTRGLAAYRALSYIGKNLVKPERLAFFLLIMFIITVYSLLYAVFE